MPHLQIGRYWFITYFSDLRFNQAIYCILWHRYIPNLHLKLLYYGAGQGMNTSRCASQQGLNLRSINIHIKIENSTQIRISQIYI